MSNVLSEAVATPVVADPASLRWQPSQRRTVAMCCAAYMVDGMDVLIMSYIAPALAHDWNMTPGMLGLVFSAGLAGMMVGGLAVAPLADVFGRRTLMLSALAVMAAGMVATGLITTVPALIGLRLLVGIGLGTLVASASALGAEAAPVGKQNTAVGLVQTGYPLGSILTGFVAVWAIPTFGWHRVLIGAGVFSALMVPIAFAILPESTAFLAERRMGRVAAADERSSARAPHLSHLFTDGRWSATLLTWLAVFFCSTSLFFVLSWVPRLVVISGLSQSKAIFAGIIYNIGAYAGTLLMAILVSRFRQERVIAALMLGGAMSLVVFGTLKMPLLVMLLVALLIGLTVQGGFNGYAGLAASLYPTEIRSSGIGWAIGIGRGGAILGPLAGGILLGLKTPLPYIFLIFAAPLLAAGGLVWRIKGRNSIKL